MYRLTYKGYSKDFRDMQDVRACMALMEQGHPYFKGLVDLSDYNPFEVKVEALAEPEHRCELRSVYMPEHGETRSYMDDNGDYQYVRTIVPARTRVELYVDGKLFERDVRIISGGEELSFDALKERGADWVYGKLSDL